MQCHKIVRPRSVVLTPDGVGQGQHTPSPCATPIRMSGIEKIHKDMPLRRQLAADGLLPAAESPEAAARALDELRTRVGPIGIPVAELIEEGRRR